MSLPKPEPLCRYRYDPLDRLASCLPLGQADTHCFYRLNKMTTEIQGQIRTSWLQAQDQLLAQWQQDAGKHEYVLIATDTPGSVIHGLGGDQSRAFGYMPYGTRSPLQAPLHLPGFNGERLDPVTGHYLLGNGYRAFNPVLMRFNSPDSLSPFGEGGLNAYAYCSGDPVNNEDSSGHALARSFFKYLKRLFTSRSKAKHTVQPVNVTSSSPVSGLASQRLQTSFVGFHGTSEKNARSMIKNGVTAKSKHVSLFVSNTFEGAQAYAKLNKKGVVLGVYTHNIDELRPLSVRSLVTQSNIEQLKITSPQRLPLTFKPLTSAEVSSNFNRFMTQQESTLHWIEKFRTSH